MTRSRVRPATARDLPAIVGLERSIPELPHWNEAEYERYLQVDTGVERCLLVVEEAQEGRVTGFAAALVHVATATGDLESVAVLPGCRRAGLGRLLCAAALDWCRRRGAAAVELEVRAGSEGALALYRSLGFMAVGRRPGYYGNPVDDAVLMSLVF